MYEGLYDTRKGLSDADAEAIGRMTARLMFPWDQWMHRRVDRVTFSDEDALRRDVSIDFTVPYWFHQLRETPEAKPKRQLVPIGFFQKEALANFSLTDENYTSLPLLTTPQTSQVAEAVLLKIGELSLGANVPVEIGHDIHGLIRETPQVAARIYKRLFNERDSAWRLRDQLKRSPAFFSTAAQLRDGFLALTMIDIRPHERRVIHFSFEEQLTNTGVLISMLQQAIGRPRRIGIGITAPSGAASYHLEVEAPEGLMITECLAYHHTGGGIVNFVPTAVTRRRAHCHFTNTPFRSQAGAGLDISPRRSSVVRAATLMAILAFIATLAVAARFHHIEGRGDTAAPAALLVAVTGVIGLVVVRSGEGEMATSLLFPLRVLSVIPAVLGILAAVVIVLDPTAWVGYCVLGLISLLILACTGLLIWNWHKAK